MVDVLQKIEDALRSDSDARRDEALDDAYVQITWLRSSLVSLWTLAEAENSPLTLEQVAMICKHTLNKFPN
jgi:hypothetical protein